MGQRGKAAVLLPLEVLVCLALPCVPQWERRFLLVSCLTFKAGHSKWSQYSFAVEAPRMNVWSWLHPDKNGTDSAGFREWMFSASVERSRFGVAKLGTISQSQALTIQRRKESNILQRWRTGAWDLGHAVLSVHVNCLCGQFSVFTVKNLDLPKLPLWKKRERNFQYSDL